jgi:hypothetical protein
MNDTSASFASKLEFRLVSLGLGVVVVATLILSVLHGKTIVTADSPIVVRGGSMTAFTTHWANGNWSAQGAGYCVNVYKTTTLATFKYEDGTSKDIALGTGWKIDVYGHVNTGDSPSPKGFEFAPQFTVCGSTTTPGQAITLTPIGLIPAVGGTGFYTSPFPTFTDHASAERFKDANCNRDDADLCERMASVVVTPASGTPTLTCHTGDCSLAIGN